MWHSKTARVGVGFSATSRRSPLGEVRGGRSSHLNTVEPIIGLGGDFFWVSAPNMESDVATSAASKRVGRGIMEEFWEQRSTQQDVRKRATCRESNWILPDRQNDMRPQI